MIRFLAFAIALAVGGGRPLWADAPVAGFKLPPGFSIHEYAGSDLVNDLQAMTIDAAGRVYVANRGSLVLLPDENRDGRADRAVSAAEYPKDGAMGLLVEWPWLYFTGDGMVGRVRLNDAGVAVGKVEPLLPIRTGNEHAAHALRRGPDGWLYLAFGNQSEIEKALRLSAFDADHSPVTRPIAGGVIRIAPDFKKFQIICDGFRNAYDMDFTPGGKLFTYDSDNERCVSLPWYEGTRFYEVVAGGHYGWQNPQRAESWRLPPYFLDVVAPLADLGRGSPTGVTCYTGRQFPAYYQDGVFVSDWTFGTVRFIRITESKNGTKANVETFLEAIGENGFAPSASFVHPLTGELFVAIGGRGTRGAVYRIRYDGPQVAKSNAALASSPIRKLALPDRSAARRRLEESTANELLQRAENLLADDFDASRWLDAARLAQLALGQLDGIAAKRNSVFEGYSGTGKIALPMTLAERFAMRFPTADGPLDREIARLFAVAGGAPASFVEKLTATWTDRSDSLDDIHGLIVFARLARVAAEPQFTQAARSLLALDRKLDARKARRDRNWPLRISEIQSALAKADPNFDRRLVEDPEFGRFDHALFAKHAGFDRIKAARTFLNRLAQDSDRTPTSEVVGILGALPKHEVAPLLRTKWDEYGLRPKIAVLLARSPNSEDLDRFLEGAKFTDIGTARTCVNALIKIGVPDEPQRLAALLDALKTAESAAQPGDLPDLIRQLLHQTTSALDREATTAAWVSWLQKKYPASFATTPSAMPWRDRLSKVDWMHGSASRGEAVFRKLACANCHNGNRAVGPDLHGVAGRFSREDFFTAIFEPNRDVASRYRTTVYSTHSGKVYEGMVVYQAADGTILQTGLDTTVRIAADDIAARRPTNRSLMPAGLLDRSAPADLADLYAYLKSLTK